DTMAGVARDTGRTLAAPFAAEAAGPGAGPRCQTLTECGRSLTLFQQLGDRDLQGVVWDSLGYAHHNLGHHDDAVACYRNALDLFREQGDRYFEAETLIRLGDTYQAMGNSTAARTWWQLGLERCADVGHPDIEQVRAKLGESRV
ncbi:MAG TPA: tetratricopeptide repeat protein, partial [Geodermatophilus sp.]|nr:tetratricopeptide repeat protein [Geodermatophilus sp.]